MQNDQFQHIYVSDIEMQKTLKRKAAWLLQAFMTVLQPMPNMLKGLYYQIRINNIIEFQKAQNILTHPGR